MIEIFLALAIGTIFGIVTGLLPGLHPNNTIPIILGVAFIFEPLYAAIILISTGVINCFINFIPSVLLGAPEDSTVLGVLPGHRLLLEGRGFEAIKLSALGSFGGVILAILILPLFAIVFPFIYTFIRPQLHWILIGFVIYMIAKEENRIYAIVVFLLSGILGVISLNFSENTLFPLLSGLFGLSTLLISYFTKTKLPESIEAEDLKVERKNILSSIGIGGVAGILAGLLPGIGSSQATALTQQVFKRNSEREFLISIGAVATSDLIYSLMALWLLGNPRSGIAVAVGKLLEVGFQEILIFIPIILISACIGLYLTLSLSKVSLKFLKKINYNNLCFYTIVFVLSLVLIFSDILGLLIALIAITVGIIPNFVGIRRTHAMGCLLLPTILFFAGFT